MTDHQDDMSGSAFPDDDLDLLDALLAEEGVAVEAQAAGIQAQARPAHIPLSFSQELLWLLDRATPGLTAYNMPLARRLTGRLDVDALGRALTFIASRHEILRTRLPASNGGEPEQVIDAPGPVTLNLIDITSTPPAAREAEATRIVRERARVPFDLANEHTFRCTLVHLGDDDHVLLVESHHIAFDGWSASVLLRELSAAYHAETRGAAASLPPLAVQYADFAIWQREQLAGDRLAELMQYWREQLTDAMEPLSLPTDRPRPTSPTFAGARSRLVLPAEMLAALKAFGQKHDATLYMTLLAAYMTVLHRYTGREQVLVGSGSAGRTHAETEPMIGYLANTLVQRGDFRGDPTFADLLGRVRESALGAYDHQDVPLEKLVMELREGKERLSNAPLFEVVFTMQNTIEQAEALGDVMLAPFGADLGATKFDITLLTAEREDGLALALQYRSDLFDSATMERFLGHLRTTLESAMRDPAVRVSVLPMLTAAELSELAARNATEVDEGSDTSIVALIETSVDRVPNRAAVAEGERTLTYAGLDAQANQLARVLRARSPIGAPVGLLIDRSIEAMVGVLGIMKSGAPYVPLPVDLPAPRLAQRLAEAGVRVVVTLASHAAALPDGVAALCLDRDDDALRAESGARVGVTVPPDSLAYILYTSGSTGVPKGVGVSHRNLVHYTRAVSRVLGDGGAIDGWTFGLASTLGADLGNTSIYPALASGGTLVVLPSSVTTDPARFADAMAARSLDVLKITPNHLRALVAGRQGTELAAVLPAKWLVSGGEAFSWEFAAPLRGAARCRVLNHYGPTEATVGVMTFEVTDESIAVARGAGAQTVPIGFPLANTQAYVLDARQQQLPVGVPGELYLGGAGIASGYVGQPALTAERFLHDPVSGRAGARVYRSGDRVRRHVNGAIEFLGRVDDQVKVRGYRVELGEIEHTIRAHPGVAQAVVVLRAPANAEPALVAYAVSKQAGYAVSHSDRPTPEKMLEWLATELPAHMVPSTVMFLDELPLTANGKVDRTKLPAPPGEAGAAPEFVAPRTPAETQLAGIWADALKRERVGVTDNFLALGGHSLLAIRVLGKISKVFGVRMPLRTLFDAPTVEQLAVLVEREKGGAAAAPAGITARARDAHRIRTPGVGGES